MHVGFVSTEYPPLPSGGIGTAVRSLARGLVHRGHRVTVLGWAPEAHDFEDEGVRVRMFAESRIPKTGWFLNRWAVHRELRRLVENDDLAIVEAPDWCGPSAGMRPRCPLVIRCHGSATYFAHLAGGRVRPSVRLAEALALGSATALGSVSAFTGEMTRRLFDLEGPFEVLYNGIDPGRFSPPEPAEVEQNTILYLGTVVRKKGVLDLGPIFSRVVAERPEARLRVVGKDAADPRTGSTSTWSLVRKDLSRAAAERTDYMGVRPHDEVQELVRRAGVCLFPSYAEAFPVSWLEAMACARPLVAYDVGWARESVEAGRSGVLVRPGDTEAAAAALLDLLENPERARAVGVAARERVEARFTADKVAERTLRWYRSVVDAESS